MNARPVFVYHEGSWRLYRWTRDLLDITSLGDVIPALWEEEEAGDRAADHVYTLAGAPADIVALREPDDTVWRELETVVKNNDNGTRPDRGLPLAAEG
jgi:hypothetical protein